MNIKNKNIIVIGSGKSGLAAAKLAHSKANKVSIYDQTPFSELTREKQESLEILESKGIKLLLGIDISKKISDFDLIIKSPGVPMEVEYLKKAKKDNIALVGEFEFASTYNPGITCAITGTNGKTTTTALVAQVAKAYKTETHVVGNIGKAFTREVSNIKEKDFVIAEASSFQLEAIASFKPKISCVLNIDEDHLNRHLTMENYINMKKRVFLNQNKEDYTVLNFDDPLCKKMAEATKAKVIWFSRQEKLSRGVYLENGSIVENIFNEKNIICQTKDLKILGDHNIENALAAVTILTLLGVPKDIISKEIIRFVAVAHRIEYIGCKNNIDFYNDSKATNPDAAIKGLLSMDKPVRLLVGGLDKKSNFDKWISLFPGRVSSVYIIGESKNQIIESLNKINFKNYKSFNTLEEATRQSYADAEKGESILLSPGCASWDMFDSFEQRGEAFRKTFQDLRE